MKKIIVLLLVLFLCVGCTKTPEPESPTTPESGSSANQPNTGTSDSKPSEEQPTSPRTTPDVLKYLGQTVGDVKQNMGESFHSEEYFGKSALRYDDPQVCFLTVAEDGFVSDGNEIVGILLYEGTIEYDIPVGSNFNALKDLEGMEQPVLNEQTEEYTALLKRGNYSYTFYWSAEPKSASADFVYIGELSE